MFSRCSIHCASKPGPLSGMQEGFELGPEDLGLLGAVVVDTQGDHLPALVVEDGALADPRPRPWRSGHGALNTANGAQPLQKVQVARGTSLFTVREDCTLIRECVTCNCALVTCIVVSGTKVLGACGVYTALSLLCSAAIC